MLQLVKSDMRTALPWLLIISGCYIDPATAPNDRDSESRSIDAGGQGAGSRPRTKPEDGGHDSKPRDRSDAGGDANAAVDDADAEIDAGVRKAEDSVQHAPCKLTSADFACAGASCDQAADVSQAAADIVASRGLVLGSEAVVQVLFAADPFEVSKGASSSARSIPAYAAISTA